MELEILQVKEKGDANERLVLRALKSFNIGGFVVMDKTFDADGDVVNLGRHAFKFPAKEIKEGDYVVLFTRAKIAEESTEAANKADTVSHFFYWGREATVWNQGGDVCTLLKIVQYKAV